MKNLPDKKPSNLIKQGSIFQLGDHLLLCGDATDTKQVAGLMQSIKVSLILTDPPYGVGYVEGKSGFKQKVAKEKIIINDHLQTEAEYRIFTSQWLSAIVRHLQSKNSVYIFNSDKMLFALKDGMQDAKFRFTQLLIWIKQHAVVGRMDYLPQHELIVYGWHGTHKFLKGKDKSVLFYPKPNQSKLHPTTKPLPLLRHLILNSTKIGDVVYDCFGGSGSTLIACQQTHRKCVMVELDPEYCQTIIDRFEKLTGQKAVQVTEVHHD